MRTDDEPEESPLRKQFPPLTAEQWEEETRRWMTLDAANRIAVLHGITVERARELLALVENPENSN